MPDGVSDETVREIGGENRLRPAQRREQILAEVQAGDVSVLDLSERFEVSPSTIRRDLQRLMQQGRVARTYGGAIPHSREHTFDEKQRHNFREKDAIARTAVALIDEAETIIVDAGTTTGRLAWHLREREDLTIITVGVNVLHTLGDADGPEVISLGGHLRRINQGLLGSITESNLSRIRANAAFVGAERVSAQFGISCPTVPQSYLKELMLQQADKAFVLADHTKLEGEPFPYFAPLERPYTLVTDSGASVEQLDEFAGYQHATILVAETARARVANE